MNTTTATAGAQTRPLIIIESPFAGNQDRNLVYLRRCLRDSWEKGELPFASHGFFPFFLRESDPEERKQGIEAGYRFWDIAQGIAFYSDYGMSPGMEKALDRAVHHKLRVYLRTIGRKEIEDGLPQTA